MQTELEVLVGQAFQNFKRSWDFESFKNCFHQKFPAIPYLIYVLYLHLLQAHSTNLGLLVVVAHDWEPLVLSEY